MVMMVVVVSSVVLGHCPGRLLGLTWSLVTWHVAPHSTRVHVYSVYSQSPGPECGRWWRPWPGR